MNKNKWKKYYIVGALLMAFVLSAVSPASVKTTGAYEVSDNMQWWVQDKFGMFIHLGSYSGYGQGEWAMSEQKISKKKYQKKIASQFNPVNFNAEEIVQYAKNAGMKYIVITAKHHEGFSMWDTQVESFKDYTGEKTFSLQQYTPFGETGRDILMELKTACESAGLKFGLYYSIIDWNHSSQEIDGSFTKMKSKKARTAYIKDMKAQLQELVTLYDPAVMWFDGDWTHRDNKPTLNLWWTKSDGKKLYNYMKKISPDILVNERVCRGFELGDFECPEQSIPSTALERPWETCQTMNDAWGYKETSEDKYRDENELIQELVTVAARSGNYLLNIGPKGDGSITDGCKKILEAFASWTPVYQESIYGTTGNPFSKEPSWGVYTQKDNKVYAHVLKWPAGGSIKAGVLEGKILKKVYLLNAPDTELTFSLAKNKAAIALPETAPNQADSVIVMEYE